MRGASRPGFAPRFSIRKANYGTIKKRHQQKLIVLSIGLLMCLNLPVVLIFNRTGHVYGVPVLYLFLFIVWLASIILTYINLKKNA